MANVYVYDPDLLKRSDEVLLFNEALEFLVTEMWEAMYRAKGIGLSAIQCKVALRVCVIDCEQVTGHTTAFPVTHDPVTGKPNLVPITTREKHVMINPVIEEAEGVEVANEGCLSLPFDWARISVERATEVVVRYQELSGEERRMVCTGMLARAVQHEVDHMNGRLIFHHLDGVKRSMFMHKLKKIVRYYERNHDLKARAENWRQCR